MTKKSQQSLIKQGNNNYRIGYPALWRIGTPFISTRLKEQWRDYTDPLSQQVSKI